MIKKYKKLKSIATIISGYTFRNAIRTEDEGNFLVIQSKDIGKELYVSDSRLVKVSLKTTRTNSLIKNADVVISSRGSFKSAVIKSTKKIIASSSIYILRVTDDKILPEFLSLYINSIEGQKSISNITTGATIKAVLVKDLENLKIPTVSMDVQENIVKLYKNQKHQSELLNEKMTINSNIFEGILQKSK